MYIKMDTYTAYIYRIICDLDNEEYVGSTKQTLCRRMVSHRTCAKNPKYPLHIRMNALGVEHFKIVLIEEIQVKNNEELRRREQEVIEERKASLNINKAWINEEGKKIQKQEYNEANKAHTLEVQKAYREANKEKRAQHNKEYHIKNRAAISERIRLKAAETGSARIYSAKKRSEDKASGKYKCEKCNTVYTTNGSLKLHLSTNKHKEG